MHGHHAHPYAVQTAAFFVALAPIVVLFVMMIGARFFDGVRRARKPAPVRPLAIAALARPRAVVVADG
jgi:hypothetical protein